MLTFSPKDDHSSPGLKALGYSGHWNKARNVIKKKQLRNSKPRVIPPHEEVNAVLLKKKQQAEREADANATADQKVQDKAIAKESYEMVVSKSHNQMSTEHVQKLTSIVDQYEHLDSTILDTRVDLIQTINQYSPETLESLPRSNQEYALSTESKQLLEELNIESNLLTVCYGNEVQHKIHHELVTIVDTASDLYYKSKTLPEVRELTIKAIEFADVGNAYNQQYQPTPALAAADCSWSLLNCAKALIKIDCDIALGIYDGFNQAADNLIHAVNNPTETITNLGKTVEVAGYYLGKMIHEIVIADPELAFTAPEYYEKICLEKTEQLDAVIDFLDQAAEKVKEASARDITRETTAFLVEGYATGKALGTAGKFFKFAKNKTGNVIQRVAQKIEQAAPEAVAVTAEGIIIQPSIAEQASKWFHDFMEGTAKEIAGFIRDMPRTGNPKNIIKSVRINPSHKGIIKKFDVLENAGDHIFSRKHLTKGIYKLGKSEMDIVNEITDIILKCDEQLLLKEGSNAIETLVNGFQTTIRVEIRTSEVLSINIFKGISNYHAFPNIIRI